MLLSLSTELQGRLLTFISQTTRTVLGQVIYEGKNGRPEYESYPSSRTVACPTIRFVTINLMSEPALFHMAMVKSYGGRKCFVSRWMCATTKYRRDEGRSLGVGLQELASNHRKLL